MSLVTPWLMAEPDTLRPDARRLPAGQHAVRSRPHTHHGGGLADVGIGLPGRDLAYFTATSLDPDGAVARSSRTWSASYHQALFGYGITDYDLDTCWRDYRLGVLQAPLLTASASPSRHPPNAATR